VRDAEPEIPDIVAEMLVVPADMAVARPLAEIVATAVFAEAHEAVPLTSLVDPSL
jgi:hypothetical protein